MAFNLLDNLDITQRVQEALVAVNARKKNKIVQLSDINGLESGEHLSIEPINLQWLFGISHFKPGTIIEILGSDGIGKTTFVMTLLGMFMRNEQTPCLYVNSEGKNKRLDRERMASCLAKNKVLAHKLLSTISFQPGQALVDTLSQIDDWVNTMRSDKVGIPIETPLIVAIDTISKLVPPSEAAKLGFKEAGDKVKGLGESSNLEFSKLMHEWTRSRATFLDNNNVFMIVVSHQNESVDMSGGASFIPREYKEATNRTKIGGKALNQSSSIQVSISKGKQEKNSTTGVVESYIVKLMVLKNSLGPDGRTTTYRLRKENLKDTDTEYEPALNFYPSIAEFMFEHNILNTKEEKKRYTCTALGLQSLTGNEFGKAIQENPEILQKLGTLLHIHGYSVPVLDTTEVSMIDNPTTEFSEEDNSVTVIYPNEDENKTEVKSKRKGRPKRIANTESATEVSDS